MALSKKQASRISTLINDMNVSNIMFNSAKNANDDMRMFKCNNDNNKAIIALYDEFKIKLCTYDLAIKNVQI